MKNKTFCKLIIDIPNFTGFINFNWLYRCFIKIDIDNVDLAKTVYPHFYRKNTELSDSKNRINMSDDVAQILSEYCYIFKSNLIHANEIDTGKSLPISTFHSSDNSRNNNN